MVGPMKRLIKRVTIRLYCAGWISARVTAFVFDKIDLRSE
jgi:hypothetical protein